MNVINKTVFVICGKGKEYEVDTKEEAIELKEFIEDFLDAKFTIEERNKTVYEIEVGDKVYWLKNGKPNKNRVDIVTNITENLWGDKQYLTKEINGNKRGLAYECAICLANVEWIKILI